MKKFELERTQKCGATASVVCIFGKHIFCANVGDSRSVISRNGVAVNLSLDHKALRPDEVDRITSVNGKIVWGRVGNKLAITRAFGDFEFKKNNDPTMSEQQENLITAQPEIRRYDFNIKNGDEFILLASDGLFDKFTS